MYNFSYNCSRDSHFYRTFITPELTGATIQTSVVNRPLIFYEAFVIPPLPEELELLPPRPIKEEQDVWKQLTKR